jgi:hypothetical protein
MASFGESTQEINPLTEETKKPAAKKLERTKTKICPDHPPPPKQPSDDEAPTESKKRKGGKSPAEPRKPRAASVHLQMWSDCVKQVAQSMGVKPPIRKGTKEYEAIQALYASKKENSKP